MPIKQILLILCLTSFYCNSHLAFASADNWFAGLKQNYQNIIQQGDTELYFTGYAWHNRHYYTAAKIKELNEASWGGGIGKGWYQNNTTWQGLSAVMFSDSHRKLEPAVGYTYLKVKEYNSKLILGAGATILVTSRADINHRLPFPGALPWLSLTLKPFTVSISYVPGREQVGNVLFLLLKLDLGY